MAHYGHARMLCPPAGEARSAAFPAHGQRLPGVDERLAPPETRVEYLNGQELFAAPAGEAHASQHSQLDRVIGAHVKSPYAVSVDMLTRTEEGSDFAADVSVYEPIRDPKSGEKVGRKLEELVFEVVDQQAAAIPTRKALELISRGVRRVFAVFVKEHKLYEWSRREGRWEPTAAGAVLEDRCFVRPITASGLVDWLLADDEVAKAMLVKRPPALVAALEAQHSEGLLAEKRLGILRIFDARGIPVSKRVRARIEATDDAALLDRWFVAALTLQQAAQLFG